MDKNLTRHQGENHPGADKTAPYPVSRLAPSFDLVDLAKEIAQADKQINLQVNGKLGIIADQIKQLQNQAQEILTQAKKDQSLHRASCNFVRMPGKAYHLYEKSDGSQYFSMLSPAEWGESFSNEYIGTYQLEADMSWKDITEINDR